MKYQRYGSYWRLVVSFTILFFYSLLPSDYLVTSLLSDLLVAT